MTIEGKIGKISEINRGVNIGVTTNKMLKVRN